MRLWGIALVVLLVGAAALWRGPLTSTLWSVLGPLMQARHGGADATASTTAALADRDLLFKENLELKARLGRSVEYPRILSGVLLRPPATPYDTLMIDAGTVQGVEVGDPVAAGGTALIGTVSEVYPNASRVTLYSAPGNSYEATLRLDSGAVPVVLEGQGGGSLRAQVPANTPVEVGDHALVPGLMGGLIARVTYVEGAGSDSFSTVYFSVPVNAFMLHTVEVWNLNP